MKKIILQFISVFVFASLVAAATLQMKDGRLIRGKYLGGTANSVNFLIDGKVQTYAVSDILLVDFNASSPAAVVPTPAPPPRPADARPSQSARPAASQGMVVTLPTGTQIQVRMMDTVDSQTDKVGDKFQASLDQPLEVNGQLVAARDSTVYGRLVESSQAGRVEGRSELRLELTGINIGGHIIPISTSDYDLAGNSRGKQTAKRTGIGAGLGAVIGAIAGGGKGAAIGAGIGGGAGAVSQVVTHGQDVHIPSETLLDFTLAQPLTIPVPNGG
ncbi:MAG: YMGG-like glycine zipper-containing protein [Terriglobia bacterium]